MGIAFYLVNTTTDASTRNLRKQRVRQRTLVLDDGKIRLVPSRPCLVSLDWVLKNRKQLILLQDQGCLRIHSQDNQPIKLNPEGEINIPPPPPPNCFPRLPEDYPPELRGEILYTMLKEKGEFQHWEGWQKLAPLEQVLQNSEKRNPQVQDTTDDAFPSLPEEEKAEPEKVEVSFKSEEDEVLGEVEDLIQESQGKTPDYAFSLPPELQGEGSREDHEDTGKPMYEEKTSAPLLVAGGRKKRGRRLCPRGLFFMASRV